MNVERHKLKEIWLEKHFEEDPEWNRKTVKILRDLLPRLTVDQIYKWGYDRKLLLEKHNEKKRQKKEDDKQVNSIICSMPPGKIQDYNCEVDVLLTPSVEVAPNGPNIEPIVHKYTGKNKHSLYF